MNLYAESSAVLSWLLGESGGTAVRRHLRAAGVIISSDLTLVECDRVIIRARALDEISEERARACHDRLLAASARWYILRIGADIVGRAREPFPEEPIRTLHTLHIASAVISRRAVPDLTLLSLDVRIRRAAKELGFALLPKQKAVQKP